MGAAGGRGAGRDSEGTLVGTENSFFPGEAAKAVYVPDLGALPAAPQRIILHWTAGAQRSSSSDREHYHYLVEHLEGEPDDLTDDATLVIAGQPVELNMRSAGELRGTVYARHTAGMNEYAVGVALCGMRGAADFRPNGGVDPGPSPITMLEVVTLGFLVNRLCRIWELDISESTVFTHFEAEEIHGVQQAGKWDITWLPRTTFPSVKVGPWLRRFIQECDT